MNRTSAIPILRGTYRIPALRRGDYVCCLVRDCPLIVTTWSDAPISWPCGKPPKRGGPPRLIVEEELARAIENESAAAICHWWGISMFTVVKWRKSLCVNRRNNEGTQILIHAATAKARGVQAEKGPTEEYRQKLREHVIRRRLWELAPRVTHGIEWTPEHLKLLGTMTDREVASRTGHPWSSVKTTRQKLGIPGYSVRR